MVTYKNKAGIGAYVKGTITINGDESLKIADTDPVFIDKNQYKTIIYNQFIDGRQIAIDSSNITAAVYTLFGEGKKSLIMFSKQVCRLKVSRFSTVL